MQPSRGDENSILHAIVAIDELLAKRGPIDDIDKDELNRRVSKLKPHEALPVYDFAINKMAALKPDPLRKKIEQQFVEIQAYVEDRFPDQKLSISEGMAERYTETVPSLLENISDYMAEQAAALDGQKQNVSTLTALLSFHATAHASIADLVVSSNEMTSPSDGRVTGAAADNVIPLFPARGGGKAPGM